MLTSLCCGCFDFYPRSPCGERPMQIVIIVVHALFLSTLSLRRATTVLTLICEVIAISIHALLAESDHCVTLSALAPEEFLSTLSLRRATIMFTGILPHHAHFYPRSPCGERLTVVYNVVFVPRFLSTLSLRRATNDAINGCNPDFISIHALLAESDFGLFFIVFDLFRFLSTLSLRRATQC